MTKDSDELQDIDLLLEESRAHRFSDPERVVYLAELARAAADRLQVSVHGRAAVADTRAKVWTELANAYRLSDELDRAEEALGRAVRHFEEGSRHPDLLARIVDRFATLLCYRRRFDEALALLDRLASFYLARGDRHLAGRTLVTRGLYTENAGEALRAIEFTRRGLELIDPARDPHLLLAGVHNLLWCASALGRYALIERLVPRVRFLYGDDRLNVLRLEWVEARAAFGLGRGEEAERLYEKVRAGFADAGLIFPTSLVSLELALVWLSRGRTSEVALLAGELATAFQGLKVGREVIVSLLLLRRAIEEGRALDELEGRIRSLAISIRSLER
ncbi:MAG: hypothetical protein ABIS20_01200 [Thermoanaerobaculia bacterium]